MLFSATGVPSFSDRPPVDHSPLTWPSTTNAPSLSDQTPGNLSVLLQRFHDTYDVVHTPLVLVVCVFGALCNAANVCVLTRPAMRQAATNVLLVGLSSAQIFLLVNFFCFTVFNWLDGKCVVPTRSYASMVYLLLNVNFNVVIHTIALVHTTALAVFRYLAIRRPTEQLMYGPRTAKIVSLSVYLIVPLACASFYFNSHVGVSHDYRKCPRSDRGRGAVSVDERRQAMHNESNDAGSAFKFESSGKSMIENMTFYELNYTTNQLLLKFNFWLLSTLCKLLPCILLAILNVLLVYELNKIQKKRNKLRRGFNQKDGASDARDSAHFRVTIMLVIVVSLFVLVEAPQGIIYLLYSLGYTLHKDHGNLADFFDMLTVFYSSINFVIYCCMSGEFRKIFKELFLRHLPVSSRHQSRTLTVNNNRTKTLYRPVR